MGAVDHQLGAQGDGLGTVSLDLGDEIDRLAVSGRLQRSLAGQGPRPGWLSFGDGHHHLRVLLDAEEVGRPQVLVAPLVLGAERGRAHAHLPGHHPVGADSSPTRDPTD